MTLVGAPLKIVEMMLVLRCVTRSCMVLLLFQCVHILSVPSVYLVTCILLVSPRYMQLQITIGTCFFPMTVVLWNRLPSGIVLLKDLDSFKFVQIGSEQDKLSKAMRIYFSSVFISFLINITNTIILISNLTIILSDLTITFYFYPF